MIIGTASAAAPCLLSSWIKVQETALGRQQTEDQPSSVDTGYEQPDQNLVPRFCNETHGTRQHTQTLFSVAGSLIIEEDEPGDAMFVVLSGQCHIRARPAHAAAIPQQQSLPPSSVLEKAPLAGASTSSGSDSEAEEQPSRAAPAVTSRGAEHSATFWIHKYMQQVGADSRPADIPFMLAEC